MKKASFLLVIPMLAGCTTGQNMAKVNLGMSEDQVVGILGKPDSAASRNEGLTNVVEYVYSNRLISGFSWNRADYVVDFRDNRVVSFAPTNVVTVANPVNSAESQQLLQNQMESQKAMTEIDSQIIQHPVTTASSPLESSNGFPNNSSATQQNSNQTPGGTGYKTGITRAGLDGNTWYEVRAPDGETFWVK
jgi:outer membrane protein assembly factor BamE (lipoprotein component of BamABCDE complex)